jgi:hypothetical protein
METRYFGEIKALGFEGRWYPNEDDLANAIVQAEWAKGILSEPEVIWPNGRSSHNAASAVLDESHYALCAREFFFA